VNKDLSDNLIRLHVIANSDSDEDQELKRNVRDEILEYMGDKLKDSKNIEESKKILNENMSVIEELSRVKIKEYGKDYGVKAMFGEYPFPTKVYGDIALPAGQYQALRVVIGKGEGANWWCVLFPPLCFVDASHGTVPDSVKKDLKNVLDEEEYKIVDTSEKENDVPVKMKFKTVEVFQKTKQKITGMFKK
jgi:stage II sporulation protein R